MVEPTERQDMLAKESVDAAFQVHVALGPGLLESVYRQCLVYELRRRQLDVRTEVALPVIYRSVTIETGFRIDLLVSDELIVEVKAVERLLPIHDAQLLTYLRLADRRLGLLINFNVPLIKQGIRRLLCARR